MPPWPLGCSAPPWRPHAPAPRRSSGRAWWRLPAGHSWRRRRDARRVRRWRCCGQRAAGAAGPLLQGAGRGECMLAGRQQAAEPASEFCKPPERLACMPRLFLRSSTLDIHPPHQGRPRRPEASTTAPAAATSTDSVRRVEGACSASGPRRAAWRRQYLRNTSLASCTCTNERLIASLCKENEQRSNRSPYACANVCTCGLFARAAAAAGRHP